VLVGIIIAVAVVLAVVLVVLGRRSAGGASAISRARAGRPDAEELARFHLEPSDFHIDGNEAIVTFDVDVPAEGAGAGLAEMLTRQAIEVVRQKRLRGLPVDDVSVIRVRGRRDGEYVEATRVELSEPGVLPPPQGRGVREAEADEVEFDPLHHLADKVFADPAAATTTRRGDELPPLAQSVRLTERLESALRDRGFEPAQLSAGDLTRGLLEVAGYQLRPGASPGTYLASRAGTSTFLTTVDHEPGSYPELSESAVNGFLAGFYASGAARGLLFSDKYGPHLVYEKERRESRVRFITRERMQAFVDSIAAL
jgi:hypothetical protein